MRILALVVGLVLCGCATGPSEVTLVFKPGVRNTSTQIDYDACKIASFKEIPQSIATDVQGGYSSPGTMSCNTIGTSTQCYNVGGFSAPATSTSYDVNDGLRTRYINACMRGRGYQFIQRPLCRTQAEIAAMNAPDVTTADKIKCVASKQLQG